MTTKTQEILDAFEVYDNRGIYDDRKRNNKFLRYMMDRTKIPSFKSTKVVVTGKKKNGKDKVKNQRLALADLTTEQVAEMEQMTLLMNGDIGGTWRDKCGHELKAMIIKQPPVIRDQLLIVAIVIYLLRHRDADFDSETKAFSEFYYNFRDIVLSVGFA